MKQTLLPRQDVRLLGATGAVALALAAVSLCPAQTLAPRNKLMRVSTHAVGAQVDPPGMPEPPVPGQGSAPEIKEELFAGTEKFAKGASDVTEVNMDPNSLSLVHGPDSNRAHRTVLSVVRTYSYDKPGMYNPADVEEYRRKLETGDWHCSVHTRDLKSGQSTDVCSKRRGADMMERAIITTSPKSLTFIHNIRRMEGGESRWDTGSFPAISTQGLSGTLNPIALDAKVNARMEADLLASAASMRAQLPAMLSQVRPSEAQMESRRQQVEQQRDDLERRLEPELEQQLRDLHHQLQGIERSVPALP